MIPNLGVFVFPRNFAVRQIRGCWFQIWQYHFQIPAQKYSKKAFLVSNFGIFIFSQSFAIRQIEGFLANLKFKDFYQTTILQQTLQEDKFEDADFKYDNNIYQLLARKYGNLTFLVPNLRIFIFCRKLCNKANSWVLISNTTIVSQNCCRKHLNVASFGSRFKNPNFCTKLCN